MVENLQLAYFYSSLIIHVIRFGVVSSGSLANDGDSNNRARQLFWERFHKLYKLKFNNLDYFIIAEKNDFSLNNQLIVIVKQIKGPKAEEKLKFAQIVRYSNFVSVYEGFETAGNYFTSFEFIPLSLSQLVNNDILTILYVVSILKQVSITLPTLRKLIKCRSYTDFNIFIVKGYIIVS